MAKELGCSLSALQAYESGRSDPGWNFLKSLSKLGFNINWVLTGVGPEKLGEAEIKQAMCEEAHKDLREYLRSRYKTSRHVLSDIPGVPFDIAEAYMKGTADLSKDQLTNVCLHVKNKYDSDDFINKITNIDMHKLCKHHPVTEQQPSDDGWRSNELHVLVLQSIIETVSSLQEAEALRYAHMSIDIMSMIAELRKDNPNKEDIKSIIHLIDTIEGQTEKGSIDLNSEEYINLLKKIILRSAKTTDIE